MLLICPPNGKLPEKMETTKGCITGKENSIPCCIPIEVFNAMPDAVNEIGRRNGLN
jgi:hypothetical protein